jgi:hypothetical protein
MMEGIRERVELCFHHLTVEVVGGTAASAIRFVCKFVGSIVECALVTLQGLEGIRRHVVLRFHRLTVELVGGAATSASRFVCKFVSGMDDGVMRALEISLCCVISYLPVALLNFCDAVALPWLLMPKRKQQQQQINATNEQVQNARARNDQSQHDQSQNDQAQNDDQAQQSSSQEQQQVLSAKKRRKRNNKKKKSAAAVEASGASETTAVAQYDPVHFLCGYKDMEPHLYLN